MPEQQGRNGTPATAVPWVLVSADFRQQGGQSKANAALADYLLARGTPVHLVAHEWDDRFRRHRACVVHAIRRPFGVYVLDEFWLRLRSRRIVRRLVAANPSTRVLVNGGCCDWNDINWIHYVHAGWSSASANQPILARLKETYAGYVFRRQERSALRHARLVLANSQTTRQLLIDRVGLVPSRVHTVYLGSDPTWGPVDAAERKAARDWLGQPEHRPLVAFVGGLGHDQRKGFDTLWAAWRELCAAPDWDADLVVAGGGAASAVWQARITEAGLAGRVRLLGFTDRVQDLLATADLLVSPARYEPYGLNVQEAVCCGVPALVSRRAGVVEQYPPDLADLILPDPDDAGDLAARLRRWRPERERWRQRFRPLSEQRRRYSWPEMAAEIVGLVESEQTASSAIESELVAQS
jgi:glycosyltransferase involved in cell wall biosynthesis